MEMLINLGIGVRCTQERKRSIGMLDANGLASGQQGQREGILGPDRVALALGAALALGFSRQAHHLLLFPSHSDCTMINDHKEILTWTGLYHILINRLKDYKYSMIPGH